MFSLVKRTLEDEVTMLFQTRPRGWWVSCPYLCSYADHSQLSLALSLIKWSPLHLCFLTPVFCILLDVNCPTFCVFEVILYSKWVQMLVTFIAINHKQWNFNTFLEETSVPILSCALNMEAEISLKVSVITHQIARCSNQLYTTEVSSHIVHPFEFPCTPVTALELLVTWLHDGACIPSTMLAGCW